MLSGETANGKFPQAAVQIMARTCQEAEDSLRSRDPTGYDSLFKSKPRHPQPSCGGGGVLLAILGSHALSLPHGRLPLHHAGSHMQMALGGHAEVAQAVPPPRSPDSLNGYAPPSQ